MMAKTKLLQKEMIVQSADGSQTTMSTIEISLSENRIK